ncbi:MAG: hypothetical protein EXR90_00360 [Methyloglobulus sp.]|nr:hypothetical protein [Pseudomonadota bacterium]MSS75382.1 hypothetical protein [Methyloglobulus sp.]
MPVFVALCLILAVIVQTKSPLQGVLVSSVFMYVGLTIAIATIIGSFFKKLPEKISYDLFASSILFAWFAYWKPLFVSDSPIFFFFPIYFTLIIAFATLFFIEQRHKIDRDSLQRMQAIADSGVVDPWLVMICVTVTLYFENRFIQYPTMMTLLTMRYALSGCLKPK